MAFDRLVRPDARCVVAVYCPWPVLMGRSCLAGLDFQQLHERRIRFAQEAIFNVKPASLPAWYPRELMGTPFWSKRAELPVSANAIARVHQLVLSVRVRRRGGAGGASGGAIYLAAGKTHRAVVFRSGIGRNGRSPAAAISQHA
jgi:hypothetical protein